LLRWLRGSTFTFTHRSTRLHGWVVTFVTYLRLRYTRLRLPLRLLFTFTVPVYTHTPYVPPLPTCGYLPPLRTHARSRTAHAHALILPGWLVTFWLHVHVYLRYVCGFVGSFTHVWLRLLHVGCYAFGLRSALRLRCTVYVYTFTHTHFTFTHTRTHGLFTTLRHTHVVCCPDGCTLPCLARLHVTFVYTAHFTHFAVVTHLRWVLPFWLRLVGLRLVDWLVDWFTTVTLRFWIVIYVTHVWFYRGYGYGYGCTFTSVTRCCCVYGYGYTPRLRLLHVTFTHAFTFTAFVTGYGYGCGCNGCVLHTHVHAVTRFTHVPHALRFTRCGYRRLVVYGYTTHTRSPHTLRLPVCVLPFVTHVTLRSPRYAFVVYVTTFTFCYVWFSRLRWFTLVTHVHTYRWLHTRSRLRVTFTVCRWFTRLLLRLRLHVHHTCGYVGLHTRLPHVTRATVGYTVTRYGYVYAFYIFVPRWLPYVPGYALYVRLRFYVTVTYHRLVTVYGLIGYTVTLLVYVTFAVRYAFDCCCWFVTFIRLVARLRTRLFTHTHAHAHAFTRLLRLPPHGCTRVTR